MLSISVEACRPGEKRCATGFATGQQPGQGPRTALQQCTAFNTWKNLQCCSECLSSQNADNDDVCRKPFPLDDKAECPPSPLGGACTAPRDCADASPENGIKCIAGTCRKAGGAPCESDDECFGIDGKQIVCSNKQCVIPEGRICNGNFNGCISGSSCIEDGSADSPKCLRGPGNTCDAEKGASECHNNAELPMVCHEGKCLYDFRAPCITRDSCVKPDGLNPETTVNCEYDPFLSDARGTIQSKCLPTLPDGEKCLSENDCLGGPCDNGVCSGNIIPLNGICNVRNIKCVQGAACASSTPGSDKTECQPVAKVGEECALNVACSSDNLIAPLPCSKMFEKCLYKYGDMCIPNASIEGGVCDDSEDGKESSCVPFENEPSLGTCQNKNGVPDNDD